MSVSCAMLPPMLPRSMSCSKIFRIRNCSCDESEPPVQASRYRVDSRPSLEVDNSYASLPPLQRAQRGHSVSNLQSAYAPVPPQESLQVGKRKQSHFEGDRQHEDGHFPTRRPSTTLSAFEHKRKGSKQSSAHLFGYSTISSSAQHKHNRGGSDGTATTTSTAAPSIFSRHGRSGSDDAHASAHTRNTSSSSRSSGRHQLRRKQAFTGLNTEQPEPIDSSAFPSERNSSSESRATAAGPGSRPRKSSISTILSKAKRTMFKKQDGDEGNAIQEDSAASFASMLYASAANRQAAMVIADETTMAEPSTPHDIETSHKLTHKPSLLDFRFHFERSNTSATLPTSDQYKYSGLSIQQTPDHAYGRDEALTYPASNSSLPVTASGGLATEISFPSSAGTVLRHALATEESDISLAVLDQTQLERSNVTLRSPICRRRASNDTVQTVLHHFIADREESGWATIDSEDEGGEQYEDVEEL